MAIQVGFAGSTLTAQVANLSSGDPYWDNVIMLLRWDDASSVTDTAADVKGNVSSITASSTSPTIQVSGPVSSPFGGYINTTSTTQYVSITTASSSDWLFDGEFTFEFWAYYVNSGFASTGGFFNKLTSWTGSEGFGFGLDTYFKFNCYMTGAPSRTTVLTNKNRASAGYDTWQFWAITRDSADFIRIYLNGEMVGKSSAAVPGTMSSSAQPFRLFCRNSTSGGFTGRIDEFRVTKGIARYTTDGLFGVPSAPFPTGS
ncbi:MAG: LamG domain-containing protein [Gammaproteobacteria bacterium]|nr:LamG domain-containing protein [Gammaproteobacteria bacterium]